MNIEVHDVTLRYDRTVAVDGMTFRLEGPGIFGLLGRNGSGKSSLLSLLAAFRRPNSGEVLINGMPVFENPAATSQVCLIRESPDTVEHGWPANKVRDALELASKTRPNWDSAYSDRLVEAFRLPLTIPVTALSKGQRGALGVTLGLAARAPITLFDESYLGMDAPSRYAFYDELLSELIDHPRMFVVSTHLIEEVSRLLQEVVIIDQGRLVMHDEKEALEARGATVIGPALEVDRVTAGLEILGERSLGSTKSVAVYGELDPEMLLSAKEAGLEVGALPLQDLFVHLTARSTE